MANTNPTPKVVIREAQQKLHADLAHFGHLVTNYALDNDMPVDQLREGLRSLTNGVDAVVERITKTRERAPKGDGTRTPPTDEALKS